MQNIISPLATVLEVTERLLHIFQAAVRADLPKHHLFEKRTRVWKSYWETISNNQQLCAAFDNMLSAQEAVMLLEWYQSRLQTWIGMWKNFEQISSEQKYEMYKKLLDLYAKAYESEDPRDIKGTAYLGMCIDKVA